MRIIIVVLLTLFLQIPSWADSTCPGGSKISYNIKQFMSHNQIPGIAVSVYVQGKIYYFNSGVSDLTLGTAITKDTMFYIASVTKVFTTTLLAEEIEDGKMALSDPIVDYLPALSSTSNLPIDQVSLQNLATYSSSFPREVGGFGVGFGNIEGLMHALKNWQPSFPIGSTYLYSNIGFQVLGLTLQNVTGESYATLVKQNIFTPLNMQHSYIFVPSDLQSQVATGYDDSTLPMSRDLLDSDFLGSGEIVSTSADLIQFVKASLDNQTYQSTPELLNAMQMTQQSYFQPAGQDIGLGWFKGDGPLGPTVFKDGAYPGFSSFVLFVPSKQIGVVVLANKNHQDVGRLANIVLNILATN